MLRFPLQDLFYAVAHFFIFVIFLGVLHYNPYFVVAEGFLLFFHGVLLGIVACSNN